MPAVTGSFLITNAFICFAVWISLAVSNKLPKQINGNQKWPSYCETYEMNFHRRWKGDDGIYFGYRFWFHCLYEQNGLFWEALFTPMAFLEYDISNKNTDGENIKHPYFILLHYLFVSQVRARKLPQQSVNRVKWIFDGTRTASRQWD